jgi:ABC-type transport system substrate-binding protein
MVPHALGEWYLTEPDMIYDYDPVEAYNTLIAGGWTYNDGYGTWEHLGTGAIAGGADYSIEILSPLAEVAVTSFTIVATLADEMNALTDPSTGDPTPIAATHAPTDFWTIVERAFYTHTYEMYFLCWGNLDSPDYLYYVLHSSWDIPWGDNAPGIHNDQLDTHLEYIYEGLDHDTKVDHTHEAQRIMMDTLCYIPTYSRNYFNAHQNEIYGVVNSPGYSIDNFWTYVNIEGWRDSGLFLTPLTQIDGNETIVDLGEHVESFNMAQAGSAYAAQVLGTIHDGLLATNPYTNEYKPWLAESWESIGPVTMTTPTQGEGCVVGEVPIVDGMIAEFNLTADLAGGNVVWHDGEVCDADDIIWIWNFIWTEGLTNHLNFYTDLADIQKVDSDTVRCYFHTTSQWLLYAAAGDAFLYPPQIYTPWVGQGDILIREFNPEEHLRSDLGAYPASAAYPWLSQVVGIGPYILHSTDTAGENTNVFVFDPRSHTTLVPGLHYHRSQGAMHEQKVEDFYHIGDVNIDSSVDITDMARIGIKYGQTGTPHEGPSYTGFIQEDINGDGRINIKDLAIAGKNYGKEKEY